MNTAVRHLAVAFVAVALTIGAATVSAHTRSLSYSDWWLDEAGATARVRLTRLDHEAIRVALMGGEDATPADYLMERVRLRRGGSECRPRRGGMRRLDVGPARVDYEWRVDCPDTGPWRIESDALFAEVAGHVELVAVRLPADDARVEGVLSESYRFLEVGESNNTSRSVLQTLATFGREGLAHIWSGWDHLVFLLVLVVSLAGLREVALAVTGFTVGHSLTLVGTALGLASPHGPTVEALIALSIVVVAAENVWLAQGRRSPGLPAALVALVALAALAAPGSPGVSTTALGGLAVFAACHFGLLSRVGRPARLRVGLAALFGLLHGFGFAGALAEMALPSEQRVLALAGFNLGVEAGQLAVVVVAVPALALLARWSRAGVTVAGSAAAAGLGAFWFVGRAFG